MFVVPLVATGEVSALKTISSGDGDADADAERITGVPGSSNNRELLRSGVVLQVLLVLLFCLNDLFTL